MEKKILIITFILVISSLSLIAKENNLSNYEKINIVYNFNEPIITEISKDNEIFHKITIEDTTCFGNPGEPLLPVKGAYILLPQNTKVLDIKITANQKISLGNDFNIIPVPEVIPNNKQYQEIINFDDEDKYSTNQFFPTELYSKIGTYSFRGFDILVLSLNPIQFKPSTGEVNFFSDIQISVIYTFEQSEDSLFRGFVEDELEVIKKVDNPIIKDTYSKPLEKNNLENYDCLIITSQELKDGFSPLITAHNEKGIKTKIKTLRDISFNPDSVTPSDIRDFVRDEYLNSGIEYVLLGGDIDIIPAQFLYVYGLDEETTPYETWMPSDLFYACLDGSYNSDGDEDWGEPTDGDNGQDVDLIADVFVGRACVGSNSELDNFISKTISYMNVDSQDEYLKKIILAGEHLGDFGIASWGGNYLDLLIDGSSLNGYNTVGIPSDKFELNKIYDRDGSWSNLNLIEEINENVHIVNHDGHATYNYNMKMMNEDISYLTNDKYYFAYSVGCNSGGFDYDDCYAETLNVKTPNGAFAVIMNARYGWFWAYSTDGDSSRFTREFWDAVFGENIPTISKANQDSKEDNLHILDRSCIRWCYYQLNYFGDPTISFHISKPPEKPDLPNGPTSGKTGDELTYISSSNDPENDQIYYRFDWGDESISGWLGPYNSNQEIEVAHSWQKDGKYDIKVIAKDINNEVSPWSDSIIVNIDKKSKREKNFGIFQIYNNFSNILSNLKNLFYLLSDN